MPLGRSHTVTNSFQTVTIQSSTKVRFVCPASMVAALAHVHPHLGVGSGLTDTRGECSSSSGAASHRQAGQGAPLRMSALLSFQLPQEIWRVGVWFSSLFQRYRAWWLSPVSWEAGAFSTVKSIGKQKRNRKGPESQHPLQEHVPSDQTFLYKAPLANNTIT